MNAVVLVEVLDDAASGKDTDVKLDDTSENYRWISLDPDAARAAGEDVYVVQALLRLQAWSPEYI